MIAPLPRYASNAPSLRRGVSRPPRRTLAQVADVTCRSCGAKPGWPCDNTGSPWMHLGRAVEQAIRGAS